MASGELTLLDRHGVRYKLLDVETAISNGVWVEIPPGYVNHTVHVKGITNATVKINVSNDETKPTNAAHEIEKDSLTADAVVVLQNEAIRWIKARIPTYVSGTISAYLVSRR
jgi:hypothetical protein